MNNELIRIVEETNKRTEITSYLLNEGFTEQEVDEIIEELNIRGLISKGIEGIQSTKEEVKKFIDGLISGYIDSSSKILKNTLQKLIRDLGSDNVENLIKRSETDQEAREKLEKLLVRYKGKCISGRIYMPPTTPSDFINKGKRILKI